MDILAIKTADELADPELETRWKVRRAARQAQVLRSVLRAFVDRPGPVSVETIAAALSDQALDAVRESLVRLDADDLIQLDDDRVETAYPFSAARTPFVVRLEAGHERFACCAIDALGVSPMLEEPVKVRSRCHHSVSPIEFPVTAEGPGAEAAGVMVWVGKRQEGDRRVITSF